MKKFLVLIAFVFACCSAVNSNVTVSPSGTTSSTFSRELLEAYSVTLSDNTDRKKCGGTIIKSDGIATHVLTALHCVLDKKDKPISHGFVYTNTDVKLRFEIKAFSRANDLALLIITDPHFPLYAAPVAAMDVNVLDDVVLVGYGAAVNRIFSKGTISKLDHRGWGGQDCHIVDITAWHGDSGGGVFNSSNELVGVMIQFGPQGVETGWMFYVKLAAVKAFTKR